MTENELRQVDATIAKLLAETSKLNAKREAWFYPIVVASGVATAVTFLLTTIVKIH
jgi:type II secretory pathway component PulF